MGKLTPEQRKKNMQANKSSGTMPEILLAKALYAKGYRYRKNNKSVFGCPDLTFKSLKLAVFVDGEFWHGKDWENRKYDHKTNKDFWLRKIENNIERDKKVNTELENNGWHILRFWSKDVKKDTALCVLQIESKLTELRANFKNNAKYSREK